MPGRGRVTGRDHGPPGLRVRLRERVRPGRVDHDREGHAPRRRHVRLPDRRPERPPAGLRAARDDHRGGRARHGRGCLHPPARPRHVCDPRDQHGARRRTLGTRVRRLQRPAQTVRAGQGDGRADRRSPRSHVPVRQRAAARGTALPDPRPTPDADPGSRPRPPGPTSPESLPASEPLVDLIVTKRPLERTVRVGQLADFEITVRNGGEVAAEDVAVFDRPRRGGQIATASASQGRCNQRRLAACRAGNTRSWRVRDHARARPRDRPPR